MTATGDVKAATAADLAAAIGEEDAALADVQALVGDAALAKAWASGWVEFGRRKHCVTGRPGVAESKPSLVVEDGYDWTGEKTAKHKRFSALAADSKAVPDCKAYKKYVLEVCVNQAKDVWELLGDADAKGRDTRWTTTEIDKAEAADLLALRVRLTDKGLAAV